jgi:hypothetical protein
MRLRSSAHPSHVLDSFHWHGGILALSPETARKQKKNFQRGGTEEAEER